MKGFGIILLKVMDKKKNSDKITEAFENPETITRALVDGVRKALLQHKQAGRPIVVWRDGKAVWLESKEIHP